jgi:SAM-dependent methyltransferase
LDRLLDVRLQLLSSFDILTEPCRLTGGTTTHGSSGGSDKGGSGRGSARLSFLLSFGGRERQYLSAIFVVFVLCNLVVIVLIPVPSLLSVPLRKSTFESSAPSACCRSSSFLPISLISASPLLDSSLRRTTRPSAPLTRSSHLSHAFTPSVHFPHFSHPSHPSLASTMAAEAKQDNWEGGGYNKNASFVYSKQFTSAVVDLLDAKPGVSLSSLFIFPHTAAEANLRPTGRPLTLEVSQERVLDLGCGSGDLTLSSLLPSVLPSGSILGVDSSPDLLSLARSNTVSSTFTSTEREQIQWVEQDGHDLAELEEGDFDAVFSNAALHWMKRDPERVVKGVWGKLKKGGRFVGEVSFDCPFLSLHFPFYPWLTLLFFLYPPVPPSCGSSLVLTLPLSS